MALNVLSIGMVSECAAGIAGGDTKFISQANGVGKRVAGASSWISLTKSGW